MLVAPIEFLTAALLLVVLAGAKLSTVVSGWVVSGWVGSSF